MHFPDAVPPVRLRTRGLHGRIYSCKRLIDVSVVGCEIFMSGFIIVHDKGNRVVVSYYKQTRFTNTHRSLASQAISGELSTASELSSPRRVESQSNSETPSVTTCQTAGGYREAMTTPAHEGNKKRKKERVKKCLVHKVF